MADRVKITPLVIQEMKRNGQKISKVCAYDYPTAVLADQAGIEIILVGDSLSMVVLGHKNTLTASMDEMINHTRAVATGCKYAMVVGDMPYMSYQTSAADAIRNAGRLMAEGCADAVKLEGGKEVAGTVRAITAAGIPVMAHIGLTPQSVAMQGGFKAQGRQAAAALKIIEDAISMEQAGAFSIVLEAVPARVTALITERLSIPTLGTGAGPHCDGQGLNFNDMFGFYPRFTPKFGKKYGDISSIILEGFGQYMREVKDGGFPEEKHCYAMSDDEHDRLLNLLVEKQL